MSADTRRAGTRPTTFDRPHHLTAVGAPLAVAAVVLLAVNLRLVFGSSSAVISDIRTAYDLGPASAGLLTTGPVACLGLFSPLAPRALRHWSVPTVLTASLLLVAAGTAARGIDAWAYLLAGTLIAGIGIAVANVLGPVFVRGYFAHRIGVMTGLFTALVSASAGLASGATVPLADHVFHSWRTTLLAWALPTTLAVLVLAAVAIRHRRVPTTSPHGHATAPTSGRRLLQSPTAWAVTGFMGVQSLLAYSLIAWLPTLYRDRGLSAEAAGLVLTVLSLASIATALIVPIVAARLHDQRLLAVSVVALSVLGLTGVLVSGQHLALCWAVLLGLGQGGQLSFALAAMNLRARDAATVAQLSTMAQSIGYLIAALGPVATGLLHSVSGGWTVPIVALTALMAALAACGWAAGRPHSISAEPDAVPAHADG
ncbi:MFS transporter [Gordonia sp. HY002]|uniref:MFS transporter n=1 Tax=Gordonia zhenghanii TaxID=2911516 RepID=UPI001EF12DFD|nr:MFS transporter [Gordonia zhenghanii]MCF8569223.1 MFS transporter [Gordonia zhenghanii]MCF8603545.1 MFS transporter [Gordonia zhenghanii]